MTLNWWWNSQHTLFCPGTGFPLIWIRGQCRQFPVCEIISYFRATKSNFSWYLPSGSLIIQFWPTTQIIFISVHFSIVIFDHFHFSTIKFGYLSAQYSCSCYISHFIALKLLNGRFWCCRCLFLSKFVFVKSYPILFVLFQLISYQTHLFTFKSSFCTCRGYLPCFFHFHCFFP